MPPIREDRQAEPLPRDRSLDRGEQSTHDSWSSSESSSSSSSSSPSQETTPKRQISSSDNDPKRPRVEGSSPATSLDRVFSSAAASDSRQPASSSAVRSLETESDAENLSEVARRIDPSFGSSKFPYQGPAQSGGGYQGADRRNASSQWKEEYILEHVCGNT